MNAAWKVRVARTAASAEPGFRTYPLADVQTKIPFAPKGSGQVKLDRTRGSMIVETPRTAGGFVPSGEFASGPLRVAVGNDAATVWASSVDGRPLQSSKRILVTHLTDIQADGNVYTDRDKRVLLKWGSGIVVRCGEARIFLTLDHPERYDVWGLETSGRRLERLPTAVRGGRLSFMASVAAAGGARLLYEVIEK